MTPSESNSPQAQETLTIDGIIRSVVSVSSASGLLDYDGIIRSLVSVSSAS
jgi:hypothetical protein